MLFRDVTNEALQKALKEWRVREYDARRSYFKTCDDYYDNTVADDANQSIYFPKNAAEEGEEYRDRIKFGTPWVRIFFDKIIYYQFAGKTTYKWDFKNAPEKSADGKIPEDQEQLKNEANQIKDQIFKYNNYENLRNQIFKNMLLYGLSLAKPVYYKYNPNTKKEFMLSEVPSIKGTIKWLEYKPQYFWPLYNKNIPGEITGSWICYDYDNGEMYIADDKETGRYRYYELITQDVFDPLTGKQDKKGEWQAWENGNLMDRSGPNKYGIFFPVIWQTIDGESFIKRGEKLLSEYNRVMSSFADVINMNAFAMPIFENADPPEKLIIGPRRALSGKSLDPQGKDIRIRFESPQIQVEAFKAYIDKLERFLSFAFGVPLEVLHGLEEAAAKSGVQLKMMYGSLIQLREDLQRVVRRYEMEMMYNAMYMLEVENKKIGRYTDVLEPVIEYKESIVPTDEDAELTRDIIKLNKNAITIEDFVLKWNPNIKSPEEAKEYIAKNKPITFEQQELDDEKNRVEEELDLKPSFQKTK